MIEKIKGTPNPPFRVVALCEHQGRFFCATEQRVYELIDGMWHPMIFVDGKEGIAFGVADGEAASK